MKNKMETGMSLQLVNVDSLDALFGGGGLPMEMPMHALVAQGQWAEPAAQSGAQSGTQGGGAPQLHR
jgi:hypothetical protein